MYNYIHGLKRRAYSINRKGKMMNIAEQIKAFYVEINMENGRESISDYEAFVTECQEKSNDIDQDIDNESTTYEFVDDSVIVLSNSNAYVYGSK